MASDSIIMPRVQHARHAPLHLSSSDDDVTVPDPPPKVVFTDSIGLVITNGSCLKQRIRKTKSAKNRVQAVCVQEDTSNSSNEVVVSAAHGPPTSLAMVSLNNTIVINSSDSEVDDDVQVVLEKRKPGHRPQRMLSGPSTAFCQSTQTDDVEVIVSVGTTTAAGSSGSRMSRVVSAAKPSPKKSEPKCPVCFEDFASVSFLLIIFIICFNTIFFLQIINGHKKVMSTKCGHIFCEQCLRDALAVNGKQCPTCRAKVTSKAAYHQVFLPI